MKKLLCSLMFLAIATMASAQMSIPEPRVIKYVAPVKKIVLWDYVIIGASNGIVEYIIKDGVREEYSQKTCFVTSPFLIPKVDSNLLAKKIVEYSTNNWNVSLTISDEKEIYIFSKEKKTK